MAKRVGIIGLGFGAQVHLPAFQSEGWEVAAVCSRNAGQGTRGGRCRRRQGRPHRSGRAHSRERTSTRSRSARRRATHHPLVDRRARTPASTSCARSRSRCPRDEAAADARRRGSATSAPRWSRTSSASRRSAATSSSCWRDGYIGRFNLCTIELFLDRYVTAQPRAADVAGRTRREGGGILGALGSHYIDGLRDWFGEVASVQCQLSTLRPDVLDAKSGKVVQAESDDTFAFTLNFVNGGAATMIASFAATPARGARIVVMGDEGTLIAEQAGPNPMDDGVVDREPQGLAACAAADARAIRRRDGRARSPADVVPRARAGVHARDRGGHVAQLRTSTTAGAASRCWTRPALSSDTGRTVIDRLTGRSRFAWTADRSRALRCCRLPRRSSRSCSSSRRGMSPVPWACSPTRWSRSSTSWPPARRCGSCTSPRKPPDHRYAYGYSKAEYFASAFEGALILVAACPDRMVGDRRLLHPQPIEQVGARRRRVPRRDRRSISSWRVGCWVRRGATTPSRSKPTRITS